MKKQLLVISILLIAVCSFAQRDTYDTVIERYVKGQHLNGVVIITKNGQAIYTKSAGIANRTNGTPVKKDTRFKIASITKTFTAVLILQLLEEGKVKLEDNIGTHLPDYDGDAKDKVTIYQLLTYSSGIPNCEGDSGMAVYQHKLTEDEFIKKNCSGALHFAPGSQFEYNNVDYILLGKIIENITRKTLAENIRQNICNPLQMRNTGLLSDSETLPRFAHTYTYNDSLKRFSADEPYYISDFGAAGAMFSTAEDMARFDDGIFSYKLLKESSVKKMIQPDTSLRNVGLGFWFTEGYGDMNTAFVYRPGGILGASANWIHLLNEKTAFIILSNTNATSLFGMTGDLYKVYAGK